MKSVTITQFDIAAGPICRAIESCRTWSQLETAYKWGVDVVLSIGDHIARTEDTHTIKFATVERWMELQTSLCDIVRYLKDDTICETFRSSIDFIRELLPDWDDAKKMTS